MADLSNDASSKLARTQEVVAFALEDIFIARGRLIEDGLIPEAILLAQDRRKEFLCIEGLESFYEGCEDGDVIDGSFLGMPIYSGPDTDRILGNVSLGVAAFKKDTSSQAPLAGASDEIPLTLRDIIKQIKG